jgi:hypothetical protein
VNSMLKAIHKHNYILQNTWKWIVSIQAKIGRTMQPKATDYVCIPLGWRQWQPSRPGYGRSASMSRPGALRAERLGPCSWRPQRRLQHQRAAPTTFSRVLSERLEAAVSDRHELSLNWSKTNLTSRAMSQHRNLNWN